MSNNANPFIDNQQVQQATTSSNPQPQTQVNLQHIRINDISGPLVILFGPRNVGKTVTLVRLCNYISTYEIRPNKTFRTDGTDYNKTIDTFETIRRDPYFAPSATGNIDFLLLDVTYQGNKFCQILEAPGEHFFDTETPDKEYPAYLNQILNSEYRKIFMFFFELNMFSNLEQRSYADKIARLTSERISPKRDRIIIICNKCDLQPFMRDGKPIESEYKKALYNNAAFNKLKDVLTKSGFGRIPFVPFTAGSFVNDGTGRLAFTPSSEQYPKNLWGNIHKCITGKPWWQIW